MIFLRNRRLSTTPPDLQNEVYDAKIASLEKRLEDTIEIEWHQSVRIDSLVSELFYTNREKESLVADEDNLKWELEIVRAALDGVSHLFKISQFTPLTTTNRT